MSRRFILQTIDWFIPAFLRGEIAVLWQARIFVVSHLAGPFLGVLIVTYLRSIDPHHISEEAMLGVCTGIFWLLPLLLRATGSQQLVASISVTNLTFVSLYGSYFYGGMSSPFVAWVLVALLIGFFYLGNRKLLLLGIFGTLGAGFAAACGLHGSFQGYVPPGVLAGVTILSVCCATAYTSMMGAYYAQVLTLQSHLEQEAQHHMALAARLETVKEVAEKANEAKSVFIAKMSHQLRTPLNAVIGYSEMLLEDDALSINGEHTANLRRINNAGKHLLSLVTDVLDLSKLDEENFALASECFDFRAFIEEVAETCRSLVLNNGNRFDIEYGDELGFVVCDPRRLRQVVFNLLSNAGKFTKRGVVQLIVSRDVAGGNIEISVRDSGIGMTAQTLEKLFQDFSQADVTTAGRFGGTGLGLSVSQALCRMMGGDIKVVSEYGAGSCFTLSLPPEPPAVAGAPREAEAAA